MIFLVNLHTAGQQERAFSFGGVSLESGLDLINDLINKGDQLQRVRWMDEDGSIELPTYIFDGASFSESLIDLQQNWQELLKEPIRQPQTGAFNPSSLSNWAAQNQQNRIAHLQVCQSQMQQLIRSTQRQMQRGPRKKRLIQHYQQTLDHFKKALARTMACR